MKKYVFITNSTKPTSNQYRSKEPVSLTNVSRPCLKAAKALGYEVILGVNRQYADELTCDEMDIKFYNSNTFRSITAFKDNYIAYKNLCNILKSGDVEVIHCNTPIGGAIGRICGKKYKIPKVIYTAHGFHFYKGAPLFNRTILKWAEKIMAHWTDVIITLNEEDYQSAKNMRLRSKRGKVYKVNGVGIDTNHYKNINIDKEKYRASLGIPKNSFVCIGIGRIEKNKNYGICVEAIAKMNNPKIHCLICGEGNMEEQVKRLAQDKGVSEQIHFLGYRNDIPELLKASDCYISMSKREGLPRALMEAMASGLPCIVSNIRGNRDLIDDGLGGFLIDEKENLIKEKVGYMYKNRNAIKIMSNYNLDKIMLFDTHLINDEIKQIYKDIL